jgi:hypothetical protein
MVGGLTVTSSVENLPPWLCCSLELVSVAELVVLLSGARRTGRLDVKNGDHVRSLYFESGQYTGSSSTHTADRLGEILWRSGRISLDQLVIGGEMIKEGKLLGRALIELGFLQPAELRAALLDQAQSVFEAACVEERGQAVFFADSFHKSPLRFGVKTQELVDGALKAAREHRERLRKLGSLDRTFFAENLSPSASLPDSAIAVLQLAASSKASMTGRELIERAGLGPSAGVTALMHLIESGALSVDDGDDASRRVRRLCSAINLVMAALDEGGFGVGDAVREYLENPPARYEDSLSGLSLKEPLDGDAVLQQATFTQGGVPGMVQALGAVLDDALLQAQDTLPEALTQKVLQRVHALEGKG